MRQCGVVTVPLTRALYVFIFIMLRSIPHWRRLSLTSLFTATCLLSASPQADAAFGSFLPLSWSGSVSYNYSYAASQGTESETTGLRTGINATGYVWRPWFATTSLAMNVGVSNTETTTTSADSTSVTGDFSLGVFPRSRFPFSLSYSRTDSRSETFQDLTQASGETNIQISRWSLRQTYRPRRGSQQYNAWYYLTQFNGENIDSESTTYGLEYQLRHNKQSLTASATHSDSQVAGSDNKPTADVISISHVYSPSGEMGVNTIGSYVETDTGGGSNVSKDGQAASSFFWRPEHRSVSVYGGARLSELRSESVTTTVTRSLNTSLGVGYRVTRAMNVNALATLGTSDSGNSQSLTATQGAGLSYTGSHYRLGEFIYNWQWGANMSNSSTRTDTAGVTTETDQQSVGASIGHNLSRSWEIGRLSSLSGSLSQSASASKNSQSDIATRTFSNGASLSWNHRGRRGSTYANTRVNDSRSYGEADAVFQSFGVNLVQDMAINRLSSMSGNLNYDASRSETENSLGGVTTSSSQNLLGSLSYHHDRPFGVYNLRFSSVLTGSKQINSEIPSTSLRWESLFRYSLGLLTTSLNFRLAESAGGDLAKSMNFQATRSF